MILVYDIQSLQSGSRFRGIGRATLELLKAISGIASPNLKLFVLYDSSKELDDEITEILRELKVEIVSFYPYINPNNDLEKQLALSEMIKTMVVKSLGADAYVGPNIFEGYKIPNYSKPVNGIKSYCIFYDAIPIQYPEIYLRDSELEKWYKTRIEILKMYDNIFTLSKSSLLDGIKLLEIDATKFQYIGGGFSPLEFEAKKLNLNQKDFTILYFGAFDGRKNVSLLVESFAKFLEKSNSKSRLIIAGHVLDWQVEVSPLVALAKKLGIEEAVEFKGSIRSSEIGDLYKSADLYVQTSLAEGLGLGLLDAIAHGVAAIALGIPSSREILGEQDCFFENNSDSLADKLLELWSSPIKRLEISSGQKNHASKLNWKSAGELLLKYLVQVESDEEFNSRYLARKSYMALLKTLKNTNFFKDLPLTQLANVLSQNYKSLFQPRIVVQPIESNSEIRNLAIEIEGHFEGSYSLSLLNREFSDALSKLIRNTTKTSIAYNSQTNAFYRTKIGKVLDTHNKFFVSRNVYPPIAHDMDGEWNFYHCYNWEETVFPEEYVAEFNYFLDGVSCASHEVQKALIDSGVVIPTCVVPLARSNCFDGSIETESSGDPNFFTFLHISSGFPRKGIEILLEAFVTEFSEDPTALLVIKVFPNSHQNVESLIDRIESTNLRSRIYLLDKDISDSEINKLYQGSDCLVQPTKGEGFGLPIYEAQYLGLKVIATKWGGHTDFYSDIDKYGVEYSMVQSKSHLSSPLSLWAEPTIESLRHQMRKVFQEGKYIKLSQDQKNNWELSALKHLEFMEKVRKLSDKQSKVAWISTWQTRCGIAEYSRNLLEYFHRSQIKIFSPFETSTTFNSSSLDAVRCWQTGIGGVSNLVDEIDNFEPDIVVIQYNLGFFSPTQLRDFLLQTKKYKRVIEIHSMRDQSLHPHEYFVEIIDLLRDVDRILVHNLEDLNFLHELSLGRQSVFFPLATQDYGHIVKHNIDFEGRTLRIASSGFALPHKGLLELIEATKILSSTGMKIELYLYTPEHPDPTSRIYLEKIKKYISGNPLVKVFLDETFYAEIELVRKLSECDLIIYPHQNTGEAASASVQNGISSGKPVIVTPSKIFADVTEYVYIMEGCSSSEIANSLKKIFKMLKDESFALEKEMAIVRRLGNHSFLNASTRLEALCLGLINSNL